MSEVEKANAAWEESLASGAFDSDKDIFMSGWHKGRAEAIASTEAKFRELAEKWRKEAEYFPDGEPNATIGQFCNDLDSLLTTRHDAGEKSKP